MKKFLLLTMASLMTVFMMAAGRGDGSTKANAIEFDWDKGITHQGGDKALWYRVDLAPLYDEDNPSLTLYLTNPSRDASVDVSMEATVAGQSESKDYTIGAHQYKTYTANASMLVRMKQTEIYLTLKSNGEIKLSAKVFEAADLDETCKDASSVLRWNTVATQTAGYAAWWKVDLKPVKEADKKDAKITITNVGSKTVNLRVGQSLDCPSSGLTKREFELAAGEDIIDTVPQSMITGVQPDELYFSIENLEAPVSIKVELIDQPIVPVIGETDPFTELHVTETIEPLPKGATLYRIKVADMDSMAKYEPEFTYRNVGIIPAKVTVKMAFGVPAFSTSNAVYELAPGQEEVVVYKKNMLEGLQGVEYIYLLTIVEGTDAEVNFYGRFKHVREGKACKTNIDFNWETGHSQDARTTQWYAIDVKEARESMQDITVYLSNEGSSAATVKASMAFSCPYIDVQEMTRKIGVRTEPIERTIGWSSYAMMSDTIFIGLETDQDIRFWAETKPAQSKTEPATCDADDLAEFDWENGITHQANTTVWYKIDMEQVREQAAKFPTVFVQNLSSTNAVKIDAELSVICPDDMENEKRSLTIAANGSWSKQLSRNLFENIVSPEIYLKVTSTQEISIQIRLTEEAEGTSCASAIPFNWQSGNIQAANANLWYSIDLRDVMENGNDLKLHLQNRDGAKCTGVIQLVYTCPFDEAPSIQNFTLGANASKTINVENSALDVLEDSVIYINLQGTTSLRFWAEKENPAPFDTIYKEGLALIPLEWNKEYLQNVDTAWYIITEEELDKARNSEDKVKPVAHLENLSSGEQTIKAEAAFGFPIKKKMMSKSQVIKAGKHFSDTIPAGTFDQILKKDTIVLRVIRAKGAGEFKFRAELVKAFAGNSRNDAIPVRLGERYGQSANTEMWYKISSNDLKKDKNLFNRKLFISGKNAGAGDAKVNVSIYEGLLSTVDMLEEYGLQDYRERTIKKGQGKSHNVPAQAIYALGDDIELFIRIRTTDSLFFETKFNGEYPNDQVDPKQAEAQLVVPNVDYEIPGDNQEHWYQVCIPYIQNNYRYRHSAKLVYELEGTATIEATATFQDSMNCKMPVRKRTINRANKHYKGSKPLSYLLGKAIKKATKRDFDITSFQEDFVDSLLHRYITSDSITGYVRIKSDKAIKVRLEMERTKGDDCLNEAMMFDWEHGNVNEANKVMWYKVPISETLIPDTCDVMLHVDNWNTEKSDSTNASIYYECGEDPATTLHPILEPGKKKEHPIDRDFIFSMNANYMFIRLFSEQDTHIWIELIPKKERDSVVVNSKGYACDGATYVDTFMTPPVDHLINYADLTTLAWTDTIEFRNDTAAAMWDSIIHITIVPMVEPTVYGFGEIDADSLPVRVLGQKIDVALATEWLTKHFAADQKDSIMPIESIEWSWKCRECTDYSPLTDAALQDTAIVIRYEAVTICGQRLEAADTTNIFVVRKEEACKSFTWDVTGETYTTNQNLTEVARLFKNGADSIVNLQLTILPPVRGEIDTTTCYSYYSLDLDSTFIKSTTYEYTLRDAATGGCDSIITLKLTLKVPFQADLTLEHMYGDRLLMINRTEINKLPGWENVLDSLDNGAGYVKWFKEATPEDEQVGTGYYYTMQDGSVIPAGTYYATVEIPGIGDSCGNKGETQHYTISGGAGAPALIPSLARPSEEIHVINLDPEKETIIRIYTTEGLLHGSYVVRGESTYTIKAANEHGFYLVELSNDSMKTTLRYIVK